ncbi:MAG: GNAT family N-acetyltransferase [Planctomycetota bacterium]|jgi:diamine N-acetyltransferase
MAPAPAPIEGDGGSERRTADVAALLSGLEQHGVRYVISGSVAERLHGVPHRHRDLDVVPDPTPGNLARLFALLHAIAARPFAFGHWEDAPDGRRRWIETQETPERLAELRAAWRPRADDRTSWDNLYLTDLGDLDVVPELTGRFADLARRAVPMQVHGVPVLVAHVDDLLDKLTLAGRTRDEARVRALQALQTLQALQALQTARDPAPLPDPALQPDLQPDLVLHAARPEHRRVVYHWMAASDVTPSMMGPPTYPDLPVPSWQEFADDYLPHFFDGTAPERGRSFLIMTEGEAVGHVSHSGLARGGPEDAPRNRTFCELDVWMASLAHCGRGLGSAAVRLLARHVEATLRPDDLIMRPAARNPRAIGAYEKAGFRRVPLPAQAMRKRYGPADSDDAVLMLRATDTTGTT